MNSGVSVTFRADGTFLGKAIVVFRPDVCEVATSSFDRAAIGCALGTSPKLSDLMARDLKTRAVLVAGHFLALKGRFPFSLDPQTRIEANVLWISPEYLPQ